jgi:hypothetical protein
MSKTWRWLLVDYFEDVVHELIKHLALGCGKYTFWTTPIKGPLTNIRHPSSNETEKPIRCTCGFSKQDHPIGSHCSGATVDGFTCHCCFEWENLIPGLRGVVLQPSHRTSRNNGNTALPLQIFVRSVFGPVHSLR